MTTSEEQMIVTLKVRPLWKRYLLLPKTWGGHYRILRRHNGRLRSAVDAWRLAGLIVRREEHG